MPRGHSTTSSIGTRRARSRHLDQDRARLQPQHAGEERRADAPGSDEPGEVDRLRLQARDPACLVRRVECARDQACGDEHEHDAREAEEPGEIDPHPAAVDRPADRDRDQKAEQRAAARRERPLRRVERCQQEHGRLKALTDDREEGHPDERGRRTREPGAAERRAPGRASPRPLRRIHTIIHVTATTATSATTVSSPSCCRYGSCR